MTRSHIGSRHSALVRIRPRKVAVQDNPSGRDIGARFGELRRDIVSAKLQLLLWSIFVFSVALLYLITAPNTYVADGKVLLEPRKSAVGSIDNSLANQSLILDSAQAESQIQVIRSEALLRSVFARLRPTDISEFVPQDGYIRGLFSNLLIRLGLRQTEEQSKLPANGAIRLELAFRNFMQRVNARRVGQSYVLEVAFSAGTSDLAARLANSVMMQYIYDQIGSRMAAAQNGTDYLQGRIQKLQMQLDAAGAGVDSGTIPSAFFPDADSKVIAAAISPLSRSYPQRSVVFIFAIIGGPVSGVAFLVLSKQLDQTIKSSEDLEKLAGIECVTEIVAGGKGVVYSGSNFLLRRSRQGNSISDLANFFESLTSSDGRLAIGLWSFSSAVPVQGVFGSVADNLNERGIITSFMPLNENQMAFDGALDASGQSTKIAGYFRGSGQKPGNNFTSGGLTSVDLALHNDASLSSADEACPDGEIDLRMIELEALEDNQNARPILRNLSGVILLAEANKFLPDHYRRLDNVIRSSGVEFIGAVLLRDR